MESRHRKATLRDVAQLAGVSPAAVSRYLNRSIVLPAATVQRIDAAVAHLNYRPNSLARRLSRGRSEAIGLVTPDIGNPFFAALASAVEEAAAEAGYSVILCSTQNRLEREISFLDRLKDKYVDGLIFLTNHGDDGTLRDRINAQDGVVILDEDVPGTRVDKVFVANEQGGYEATRHLIDGGHRRVALVSGPRDLFSARERSAGYRRAILEAGLPVDPGLVLFGAYSPEFGAEAVDILFDGAAPPTAIFATSDYIATGILGRLRARGIRVPDDVSLIGFDDMPFSHLLDPPISTVRQPIGELGLAGVEQLLRRLHGRRDAPLVRRLAVQLVPRLSVRSP